MVRKFLLAGAALLMTGAAGAQLPPAQDAITQPVPDAAPFFIPYGTPVGLTDAKKLIATDGALVAYEKMDDTQYGSVETSIAKAKAAALYRRPTKAFTDAIEAGNTGVLSLPGAISIEGGFPIVHGGKLIGGLGCSGGASNQDATVVYKALEEFKEDGVPKRG